MTMILAIVIFTFVAVRLTSRIGALEGHVAALTTRIGVLEKRRAIIEHPPVVERPVTTTPPPARAGDVSLPPTTPAARPASRPTPAGDVRDIRPGPSAGAEPGVKASAEPARPAAQPQESLESRIGSRWLLNIGVAAIIIGTGYFEKLAIDNHWINETARVIQGGIAGLLLVAGGRRLIAKGFSRYGQMLAGCGIAVMYVAIFAAFNFYHLIGILPAASLMCAVTVLTAWLADREASQGLAVLAVGGGFLTPFLLPTPGDPQFALFIYVSALIAGTAALAHRREWPGLNIVSYFGTTLTVLAWATRFYAHDDYLPTELFLTLFCAMYLYIAYEARRWTQPWSEVARVVLWSGPVFYYLGSLSILNAHPVALLIYLVSLSLTGAIIGVRLGSHSTRAAAARLVLWLAAMAPLVLWIDVHASRNWMAAGLAAVAGIYLTQLVAHLEATNGPNRALGSIHIGMVHATGIVSFFAADLLIAAVRNDWTGAFAGAFALWNGAIAWRLARHDREHALHFWVVAASLLAIAIGLQLDGAWITIGWAAEGALIASLALRFERPWLRAGALLLFSASIQRLIGLLLREPSLGETVLFNARAACGLFIVAATYWLAWMHHRYARLERRDQEVSSAIVVAKLLLLAVATSEIQAYAIARGASYSVWMTRDALFAISWAAIGTALTQRGLGRGQAWIRAIGAVVVGAAAFQLVRLECATAPAGYVVFANVRMLASVIVVALVSALAHFYRSDESLDAWCHPRAVLIVIANALTLLFLTSEITAYWHVLGLKQELRGFAGDGPLAREMMISMAWAGYATALIVAGIRKRYAPIRYLAIAIFAATIVKVLTVDLAELDHIYRVLSVIGLGVTLLVTSFLYHRFRGRLAQAS